ncbi:uncharacterized protein LOC130667878 [Microplitis mediator]|uniref:uncharacterized protein LOC130667878 n=1 Tax=Microplitis mediator TaxID=375433 RepID=UPI002556220E|nr:uncharacterized protein LOC130667878 [Microplitis mediator]
MEYEEKENVVTVFAMNMLKIFEDFNVASEYSSNFSWIDFRKKLTHYRSEDELSPFCPSSILNTIENKFRTIENIINYYFNFKISIYLHDLEDLCTFATNSTIFFQKSYYYDLTSLFDTLINEIQKWNIISNTDPHCDSIIELLPDLHGLFKEIMKVYIQGFLFLLSSLSLELKCASKSEINGMLMNERKKFLINAIKLMNVTQHHLESLPQNIYLCDTNNHVRDLTFVELERMVQVVFVNEYYINEENSCAHNCNTTEMNVKSDIKAKCMEFDCFYIGDKVDVCELWDDVKNIQWFKDENDFVFGNNTNCPGVMKTLSSWYHFQTARYCDYCLCFCKMNQLNGFSVTAISFRDQLSDINNNKVVVGVKFIKKDGMIHIQIKESKLLPDGKVDMNNASWKPLGNHSNLDEFAANLDHKKDFNGLIAGRDFGYSDKLNLDDVVVAEDYVITGVRFRFAGDSLENPMLTDGPIELQIKVTLFNYDVGELYDVSSWVTPKNQAHRNELKLERPDDPVRSPKNYPNLDDNLFVRFTLSDMKKDASQTVVPFFDARPVENKLPFPLRGIGLFHRGNEGYGGFISFKIFIVNPSQYMNSMLNTVESTTKESEYFE